MTELQGRNLLTLLDFSPEETRALVDRALRLKAGGEEPDLRGRVATLLFFNPSVRTRVSCESALARHGGTAICLNPGSDAWSFEAAEGAVMDGSSQEHVRELAPVLSRMSDFIGVRKSDLITKGSSTASVSEEYATLARDEFLRRIAAIPKVSSISASAIAPQVETAGTHAPPSQPVFGK